MLRAEIDVITVIDAVWQAPGLSLLLAIMRQSPNGRRQNGVFGSID